MVSINIQCNSVTKRFGATEVVAPFSVTLAAGQTTALVGPSGCGKSTILRMIAGLEAPDDGTITLGSDPPKTVARRGGLAMAFQDPSLLPWRSVRANIALGAELARKPVGDVDALIDLVGLDGFADHRPAELSGGMRQRAAIARSLVSAPDVLLLDEPFGAVDAMTRRRLNADLPPLWRSRGATVVLITHSVQEAVLLSDRVLVLSPRPARIVADIPIELTGPRHADQFETRDFLASSRRVFAALEDT
ncbi:ABC transporter ATP-binding protein [Tateyamaria omphalii]|uniref:Nitrate/sulfonate/bicarbonate ABC transporter ATP-binding protein n=1 Tax=Tateyamaria omphalii TaxID=299262 RepID=A0A1P8N1D1_9RHOB|nr:ABC transporter ATP-binding protein [Tateyamaria omphalii]APX14124.1 nitrate/sulfonate/bicarbonate ABC transporter ATP-binding protein [Tateyamaria omphalii]